jgi:hypothetical protein
VSHRDACDLDAAPTCDTTKSWRNSTSRKAWTAATTITHRNHRVLLGDVATAHCVGAEMSLGASSAQAQSLSAKGKRFMALGTKNSGALPAASSSPKRSRQNSSIVLSFHHKSSGLSILLPASFSPPLSRRSSGSIPQLRPSRLLEASSVDT